jgi:hypothetical protein
LGPSFLFENPKYAEYAKLDSKGKIKIGQIIKVPGLENSIFLPKSLSNSVKIPLKYIRLAILFGLEKYFKRPTKLSSNIKRNLKDISLKKLNKSKISFKNLDKNIKKFANIKKLKDISLKKQKQTPKLKSQQKTKVIKTKPFKLEDLKIPKIPESRYKKRKITFRIPKSEKAPKGYNQAFKVVFPLKNKKNIIYKKLPINAAKKKIKDIILNKKNNIKSAYIFKDGITKKKDVKTVKLQGFRIANYQAQNIVGFIIRPKK